MRYLFSVLVLVGSLVSGSFAYAATYNVDTDHTSVSFKIRHIFTKVQGNFNEFKGIFVYEPGKPEMWRASGTIQTASIDTNVKERDKHLRSKDFFDVETYPTIEFETTEVFDVSEEEFKAKGLITIHGVQKEIVLDVEFNGIGKDPWGNVLSSFTATTEFDRRDFGLKWNEKLETGGVLVGHKVKVTLELEGLKVPA